MILIHVLFMYQKSVFTGLQNPEQAMLLVAVQFAINLTETRVQDP